jgi:hypothetical protein
MKRPASNGRADPQNDRTEFTKIEFCSWPGTAPRLQVSAWACADIRQ